MRFTTQLCMLNSGDEFILYSLLDHCNHDGVIVLPSHGETNYHLGTLRPYNIFERICSLFRLA